MIVVRHKVYALHDVAKINVLLIPFNNIYNKPDYTILLRLW